MKKGTIDNWTIVNFKLWAKFLINWTMPGY